jgi:hypothetical protein
MSTSKYRPKTLLQALLFFPCSWCCAKNMRLSTNQYMPHTPAFFNQTKYVGKKAYFFVIKKIKSYHCKTILDAPIQPNIDLF